MSELVLEGIQKLLEACCAYSVPTGTILVFYEGETEPNATDALTSQMVQGWWIVNDAWSRDSPFGRALDE